MYRTCVGTSDEVGNGDCRHECDDEEPHQGNLVESTHVHDDHDDHDCSASGSEDCLVKFPFFLMYNVLVCKVFFGPYGVAASSLVGLYDLVLVSVVSPFCRGSHVILFFFHLLFSMFRDTFNMMPCDVQQQCKRTSVRWLLVVSLEQGSAVNMCRCVIMMCTRL